MKLSQRIVKRNAPYRGRLTTALLRTSVVLALGVMATLSIDDAQAGFVADFVENAQGSANVTQAGIYESQALNVVSAGGFVYKNQRKDFVPFSVTPPSLSAGCGGIDVFLGAFSIPSKEEFLSFLKSVGTALPGLAFQLALQTMAPDLNEMVGRYADLIRSYTNRYTDSCSAAQSLLYDTGAAEHLQKTLFSAKNMLRSKGAAADQFDADHLVRDNGQKAIDSAQTVTDSSGNVIDAPEINLTWALLNSGKWASGNLNTQLLKEWMMSLVGTTVFEKTGSGNEAVIVERRYAGVDLLPILFDEVSDKTSVMKLKCRDEKTCLTLDQEPFDDMSLVERLQQAADNYLSAVAKREPSLVTDDDLMLLGAGSGVPLLRILNIVALSRYQGIGRDLVTVYVTAAAYEILAGAVHALAGDVRAALGSSAVGAMSREHVRHVEKLLERIHAVEEQLNARESKVMQAMVRASSLVTQLEHIERSLIGRQSLDLQALMPVANRTPGT